MPSWSKNSIPEPPITPPEKRVDMPSSDVRRTTLSKRARRALPAAVASVMLMAGSVVQPALTGAAPAPPEFSGSTGSVAAPELAASLPAGPFPVNFSVADAAANALLNPDTPPPGADDPACVLTPERPRPVVLVHGTLENRTFNWWSLAPVLRNAGYCVFTLNYGQEVDAWRPGAPGSFKVGGTGPVMDSAHQLSGFVDGVLAETGAGQVDIVGHSQGGMMPRVYIKYFGGADKVGHLVGMAPGNHGTDFWGLLTTPPVRDALAAALGPAVADQTPDAALIRELNEGGVTPGPRYTVIATDRDWIATPWFTGFLPESDPDGPFVDNIMLRDTCDTNFAEHLSIPFNPAAIAYVLHALDPTYAVDTPCAVSLPLVGG